MSYIKCFCLATMLSLIAISEAASSATDPHVWRPPQSHKQSVTVIAGSWGVQSAAISRLTHPTMTSAAYTPTPDAVQQLSWGTFPEDKPGGGIWMQVAAGCGLLVFGALRRPAGF
jgi:hypothetical protein